MKLLMSRALISLESSLFGFMLYWPLLRMDFQLSVHSMCAVTGSGCLSWYQAAEKYPEAENLR